MILYARAIVHHIVRLAPKAHRLGGGDRMARSGGITHVATMMTLHVKTVIGMTLKRCHLHEYDRIGVDTDASAVLLKSGLSIGVISSASDADSDEGVC